MKKLLLTFVFLVVATTSFAQGSERHKADSLMQAIPGLPDDTTKVKVLNKTSLALVAIDPDKGLAYCRQALTLAEKLQWKRGIALAYSCLGVIYDGKCDYARAVEYDLMALKIFEELGQTRNAGACMRSLGLLYTHLNDNRKAMHYDSAALAAGIKLADTPLIMTSINNLGVVFKDARSFANALSCDSMALVLAMAQNDKFSTGNALGNIGTVYKEMGRYPEALSYLVRTLKLFSELEVTDAIAESYGTIGETYLDMLRSGSTMPHDSLVSADRRENIRHAREYLSKAVKLYQEMNEKSGTAKYLLDLVIADSMAGNFEQALTHHRLYVRYKDSILSADTRLKVSEQETKREADLKEKQIQINKLQTVRKRNEQIILVVCMALLALAIVAIYYRYKHQKKHNLLQEASLRQKEMLMKEIHHRVKNNLQVIGTLLDMQLVNINDAAARDAMTESNNRLKAILLIHRQLYRGEDVATIECHQFVEDLFLQIYMVFKRQGVDIKLKNHSELLVLDIDTAVPVGLILNELMTNSHKYAFSGGSGHIDINIARHGQDYKLIYGDSGPGLPADTAIKGSKSLGMKIIASLAKQVGGNIIYDHMDKTFTLLFKDQDGRRKML